MISAREIGGWEKNEEVTAETQRALSSEECFPLTIDRS
jgi:hypothetical protein